MTVNGTLDDDQYPLPNACELVAILAGDKKFTKFYLSLAYHQLLLDEDSTKYFTVKKVI